MTSLVGAPTHYPSSSKNLTTTRGVFRKPSLISAGRLSRLRTSPGQKRPPHLHQTTSWWPYLGSDITARSEIKKTNRQINLSWSWVREGCQGVTINKLMINAIVAIPCYLYQTKLTVAATTTVRQAFPALHSSNQNNPNYFFPSSLSLSLFLSHHYIKHRKDAFK